MRYRPGLPLVLRGVSFRAKARDKVRDRPTDGCTWRLFAANVFASASSVDAYEPGLVSALSV